MQREIHKTVARRSNKNYLIFVLKEKVIQTLEDISTDVTGDWVAVPRPQPGRHVGEGLAPAGAGGGNGVPRPESKFPDQRVSSPTREYVTRPATR